MARILARQIDANDTGDAPEPGIGPQWLANLQVQRLLVMGMFACVAWGLAEALRSMSMAGTKAASIALLAFIVYVAGISLGGRADGRNYRRYTDYGLTDWFLLLVPIILILKLLPYLLEGPAVAGAEMASWVDNPARFWDVALVWSLILVFFVWDEALREADDLGKLSFQPDDVGDAGPDGAPLPPGIRGVDTDWESSPYRFVDHTASWRRLMWRFINGGFLLLVISGLSVVPVDQIGNAARPDVDGVIVHVLVYYVLGMILAGQTSLDRLRVMWLKAGAQVQLGLARRWLGYGLALVGLALAVGLLLPTSYSDGAADSLPWLMRWLWPLHFAFGAIVGPIGWLFAQLLALLLAPVSWLIPQASPGAAGMDSQTASLLPAELEPVPGAGFPSLPGRIVWGLLLYVLPSGLALYALWNTWRKRQAIWEGMRSTWRDVFAMLWGALLDLAAALWRLLSFGSPRLLRFAPDALQARWTNRPRGGGDSGNASWLRLRGLPARDLILYFYASMVQRAAALGWARGKGQTPYEYTRTLATHLPDQDRELRALTDAFVRARYSPRPVGDADAKTARGPWQRLRSVLQTRRHARRVGSWFGLQ